MQYAKNTSISPAVTRFLPPLALRLFVNTEALEHQYLEPVVDNVRCATYIFDVLTLDMNEARDDPSRYRPC